MKILLSTILCAVALLTGSLLIADGQVSQVPVKVICKLDSGKSIFGLKFGAYIASYASDCSQTSQQQGCDMYKDIPEIGPSKPTQCVTYKTLADFLNCLKNDPRFPGVGGNVVSCKMRQTGIVFTDATKSCNTSDEQDVCLTGVGYADPIDCKQYPTNERMLNAINAQGKSYGLECQLNVGGTGFRVAVPDCSDTVKNDICNPSQGTVTTCKNFGSDKKGLSDWANQWINSSSVKCKLKKVGSTYSIPVLNCDKDTQTKACGAGVADPVGCSISKQTVQEAGAAVAAVQRAKKLQDQISSSLKFGFPLPKGVQESQVVC